MYILLISRGIPSEKEPQWGCFEKDQAEALAAIGHKVVVVSVDSRLRFYWRKIGVSNICINNVRFFDIFLFPTVAFRFISGGLYNKLRKLQLRYLCKRVFAKLGKPDIIYSHYLFNSHVALDLKRKYNIPLVAIEHWSALDKPTIKEDVKRIGNITYDNADAIISVSESLRQKILLHFGKDSTVVHNLVGNEFWEHQIDAKTECDKLVYVTTGSLIHRKGFDLLITAFSKARLPKDKWHLNIIGGGEERDNLRRMINEAGLQDNIRLVGQKNKHEISEYLHNGSVFVLPSRNENFSVAVLEALACGLPVIASICGGIRECIDDSNGLLFPVDDVDTLTDAIENMFNNYKRYDREKIAADCRARFSPEVIAKQLTGIFERVIDDYKSKQVK